MASENLEKKIGHFFTFKRVAIKSKTSDREKAEEKIRKESEALFQHLESSDFVILFDESGREHKGSIDFSNNLIKCLSGKTNRVVFIIGGPYGFSEELKSRANLCWSLSRLTMNHHVAHVVALEQIYRALTIWRGIPYHNT